MFVLESVVGFQKFLVCVGRLIVQNIESLFSPMTAEMGGIKIEK